MEVFKINHICKNQLESQFTISYNKGFKVYDLNKLSEISCSNTQDNTGSSNNSKYHDKKLVLWDNNKKCVIASTQFKSPIKNIKVIKKLIILSSGSEINICVLNEKLEILQKIQIDEGYTPVFDIWVCNKDKKYYLAYAIKKNFVEIVSIFENSLEFTGIVKYFSTNIENSLGSDGNLIQNIFYNEQLNLVFVVGGDGRIIKVFEINSCKELFQFYRGKNPSYISSIINLGISHVAVSSSNKNSKTLHIYDLTFENENNSKSYFKSLINFIVNPFKLKKSVIKISLNGLSKEEDYDFFNQNNKGFLMTYEQKENYLNVVSFNGVYYKFRIDLENMKYDLVSLVNWCVSDEMKSSVFISDEFTFDLISLNKKKSEQAEIGSEESWKII